MVAYHQPAHLDAALDLLGRQPDLAVVAGATDIYPARASRAGWGSFQHADVLDISRVAALGGIHERDDHWWIGALATWRQIADAPLPPLFDGLKAAARAIGGVQVQNRATIGGNICTASPAGDSIPCLLALDAEVEIAGTTSQRSVPSPLVQGRGESGTMPLAQFFTGYRATQVSNGRGLVTGLRIPKRAGAGHFIKLGARSHLVISIAMVAGTLEADAAGRVVAARLAVGACSAVAQRLTGLERELAGQRLDDQLGCRIEARHLALLTPIDDIRADADYRRAAALAATRDLVRDLARAAKRGPS